MSTPNLFVSKAKSFLGVKEGTEQHKKIIDKYNTLNPLPRGYKVTYTDSWCAVFVSDCAMLAGIKDFPFECGCQEMYNKFPVKVSEPSVGVVIFYDWSGNRTHTSHVGIVESVSGNSITVIEGNKDDSVSRRIINKSDSVIYGYCKPNYEVNTVNNKETIWNSFMSWIDNPYGVAGLMGNIRAESRYQSNNLQDRFNSSLGMTDDEYTEAVNNGSYKNFINDGAGYGLAQWTWWSRKKMLLDKARLLGVSIDDLGLQLDYIKEEFETNYKGILETLKNAKSVREASNAVLISYENPADKSQKVQDLRCSYGEEAFKEFGGKKKMVKITVSALMKATKEFVDRCRIEHWKYFDSHSWEDNGVSCDRMLAKTLKFYFGVDEQPEGGCDTKALARTLFPSLGFTKITDQSKIQAGDIVIMGANVDGKRDDLNHIFQILDYDPVTTMCHKLDCGAQWRIDSVQPFYVPLNEWGTDPETGKWFTEAWRAHPDTVEKTPKECVLEGQKALNKYFNAGLKEDGDRRAKTEKAFISAFQKAMNLDYYQDGGMPVNGKLTKLTIAALGTHYVEYGEKPQHLTTIVEIGQYLNGRDPDGVEEKGNYGNGLLKATGKKRMSAKDILEMFKPELLEG